ncbi:MAG TPA: M1 family aminopeptidase, partial [Solirubrobacter sp.]|nr:M1 family aminopeptidase [Solirubrobacter sp.]
VLGRTAVKVAARSSARYRVGVKLPSGLKRGTYYVSACTPSGAGAGLYGCATAQDEVLVKGGTPVRGRRAAAVYRRVARASVAEDCTSGARTLSKPGMRVYPEMGNGGYISIHTDVHNVYDAADNAFLPGNHVDLQQRATQCLKDFSLDFERSNADTVAGPDLTVGAVKINGQPAEFKFVQPTYPGDPNGQDDPDPLAHRASLTNPVSADNPNPPACTPIGDDDELQNQPCPANKLVITPAEPIPSGTEYTVTVEYTGRPGVHLDGDGSTEGWFRNDIPEGDGSFVTTEPVGTMAWMPLNNHPSVKPTYDFYDTVAYDATAENNRVTLGNGRLISTTINPADANFPTGSRTFHWKSPEPIASYLVENSMGFYSLDERFADSGVIYYQAQSIGIDADRQAANKAIMDQQEDITLFQQRFNGPFPFSTDGVIVGIPRAGFEEEMQTKITFQGGRISLGTFHHENMHQWWGDNVSEGAYNLTFFKEGYASLSSTMATAREDANEAGGMGTPAGDAAFEQRLVDTFNGSYNSNSQSFWRNAPSNPTAANLFSNSSTYTRPARAYIALRAILGKDNFNAAGQEIQRTYGGGSITEPQLIAVFHKYLPNKSIGCRNKLDAFFKQWWDTPYSGPPSQGNKPQITGPGLAGPGFYDANGRCSDYGTDVSGDVGGEVPATLSLTLGGPASFGDFVPGVEDDYTAQTTATVTSTAGDATLSSTDPGHLMNGSFTLASPLQVAFSKSSWDAPVSNDPVTITFTQHIDANEPLRTGSYSKTLTFTLSTTTP